MVEAGTVNILMHDDDAPFRIRMGFDSLFDEGLMVGSGALAVLAVLSPAGHLPPLPTSPTFWGAITYLTVLCTLFAFWAMNRALGRSSPTQVTLLLGSEPLWGALFAVFWLGEALAPAGWLGGLMIAGAALWISLPPRPALAAAAPAAAS